MFDSLLEVKLLEKTEVEKEVEYSQKMIKGETPSYDYQPSSDQIHESLRIINEETLQLSEFLLQEEKLIEELCVLLKNVLKQLNMSVNVPSNVFLQTWKVQRIILNEEAHLIFIINENEVKSKALEDCPPQVILNIALCIIPELSKLLTYYRKNISSRIEIFDRIVQEIGNIPNAFSNSPEKLEVYMNPVNNGAKKGPVAKQKSSDKENKRNKEST